jgi:hypothetical protein
MYIKSNHSFQLLSVVLGLPTLLFSQTRTQLGKNELSNSRPNIIIIFADD